MSFRHASVSDAYVVPVSFRHISVSDACVASISFGHGSVTAAVLPLSPLGTPVLVLLCYFGVL